MSFDSKYLSPNEPLQPSAELEEGPIKSSTTDNSTPESGGANQVTNLSSEPEAMTGMPGFRRHTIEKDDNMSLVAAGPGASMDDSAWDGDSAPDSAGAKAEASPTSEEIYPGDQVVLDKAKELIDHFQSSKWGIVRIVIPSGLSYLVHADLLANKCSYFRGAFTGNFLEAQNKEITLENASDTTFAYFLEWLYTGRLAETAWDFERCPLSWPSLISLWFFANYTGTPELQNRVMDKLVEHVELFNDPQPKRLAEPIRQLRAAVFMIWEGKQRTPQGELAKPLQDLILAFIGNSYYMSKRIFGLVCTGGFPESFWRDFSLRCMDLNYATDESTQKTPAPAFDEHLDDKLRDAYDNDSVDEADKSWQIDPQNYYVEEAGKTGNDAEKDILTE
ncbi:hypothetical protein VSDG_05030 [Cytospora chrysosperma]|uniref:BTB domain-containing protein n=1 Tax=Cytospora chrysosperma TaxID=252740 RepID=A0A423VYL7_CYTCH|nr:hypothetical protein VSDG_05030 [Valsa sordida]